MLMRWMMPLAWGKYTKSGVTSFDVDADHMGMWTEDVSRELADYIGPYLEQGNR